MQPIAFIGLGNLGKQMALKLLSAGYEVYVYDVYPSALEVVAEAGAQIMPSARTAVTKAHVVITMLPEAKHVLEVYLGDDGILQQIKDDSVVIDCSTIEVAAVERLQQAALARDLTLLDAPAIKNIRNDNEMFFTFMVGGCRKMFERAYAILACMGEKVLYAGTSGAGQIAKMSHQVLLAGLMVATSEALALGVSKGLDPEVLSNIMLQSSAKNWVLEYYNPYPGVQSNVPAAHAYTGGFPVNLLTKDLGLALSQNTDRSLYLTPLLHSLYSQHQQQGFGALDYSSILQTMLLKS